MYGCEVGTIPKYVYASRVIKYVIKQFDGIHDNV